MLLYLFADNDNIADWAVEAVYDIYGLALIGGKENNLYDPKGLLKRSEGAAVLHNLVQLVKKYNSES